MKKLLLVALLTCSSAQAEEATFCENIESLSRSIMKSRQADSPLRGMIDMASKNKLIKIMVLRAYKEHLWATKKMKEKAINEFANTWYMACLSNEEESTNE